MTCTLAGLVELTSAQAKPSDVELLHAIFPHTTISLLANKHIDRSGNIDRFKFRDALADSAVYRVDGAPNDDMEKCLASDLLSDDGHVRTRREVRLKVLPWPGTRADFLALIQYEFADGNPPGSCTALSRLFRLSSGGNGWKITATYQFETVHHGTVQRFAMIDDPTRPLLTTITNEGGGGFYAATVSVFDLRVGSLKPVLQQPVILRDIEGDSYNQEIDKDASHRKGDNYLCFTKHIFARNWRQNRHPQTSHPCYLLGEKHK
ncbi:hypothetical protein GCM10008942_12980 [Rhizomicrobium electricum]|uniref:Uncharacterized protein n=1 Tax=Rhizomicrobium electricum TaxID=480070 RepID=A0ABP3PJ49_9PROT